MAQRSNESFTLADYRARYAQYKTDRDLQAAHHAAPWIVTWDDHEVANDYANDRDERLDPHFLARRAAAYQAFYEHMPLRLPAGASWAHLRMFQRYDWGQLARFHVLDDRQYRALEACTPKGRGGSTSVHWRDCAALRDPRRSMLGSEQEAWLEQGLRNARARWNILAQQTLMTSNSQVLRRQPDEGRYWTDGWDGYPAARQRLMETLLATRASNPLVLSGDVHSFFAGELCLDPRRSLSSQNPLVATELCGTSITSTSRPQARTQQYVDMNPALKYGRSDKRGLMLLHISPERCEAHFLALDDVQRADSGIRQLAAFHIMNGAPGLHRAA